MLHSEQWGRMGTEGGKYDFSYLRKYDEDSDKEIQVGFIKDGVFYDSDILSDNPVAYSFTADSAGEYFIYILNWNVDSTSYHRGTISLIHSIEGK